MITQTFSFLKGISPAKEQKILSCVSCWDEFLSSDLSFISNKNSYDQLLLEAKRNLDDGNSRYFSTLLPRNEHWKLFGHFFHNACYLDIETTGLSKERNKVTTVSVWDGKETHTLIHGQNLTGDNLRNIIEPYDLLITFNGSMFDVPFLQHHFPDVNFDMPHMDLRFAAKKVGLSGGLKHIERVLNIVRDDDLQDISGYEAVLLWKRWERSKDQDALNLLVKYNQEDVINLEKIAKLVYSRLTMQ